MLSASTCSPQLGPRPRLPGATVIMCQSLAKLTVFLRGWAKLPLLALMIYFRAQRPPLLEIPVYLGHVVSIWTNQLSHQWNVPRDLLRFPNRPVHCEDTSFTSGSCYHSLQSLSSWTRGDQREASPRRSRSGYKDRVQQKQIKPTSSKISQRHLNDTSCVHGSITPISFFKVLTDILFVSCV